MKIQYASDLHLEFPQNEKFLKENPLIPNGDVLLLGGDIIPFAVLDKHRDFFDYISDNFETTYWIPGNHEYYYYDLASKCGKLFEKIRNNIFLVNNIAVQHEDVKLIFSTLWSKINEASSWQIERSMSDFQVIKYNEYRFSSERFNELHYESLDFIKNELQTNLSDKTTILTHHVPTLMHYPEQYKGDILNEAFAVELFELIEPSAIDYWIYGHHHYNTSDFTIGKTKLITNQLGYIQRNENQNFSTNKYFTL
jgi:predicted phosphohydrolase